MVASGSRPRRATTLDCPAGTAKKVCRHDHNHEAGRVHASREQSPDLHGSCDAGLRGKGAVLHDERGIAYDDVGSFYIAKDGAVVVEVQDQPLYSNH